MVHDEGRWLPFLSEANLEKDLFVAVKLLFFNRDQNGPEVELVEDYHVWSKHVSNAVDVIDTGPRVSKGTNVLPLSIKIITDFTLDDMYLLSDAHGCNQSPPLDHHYGHIPYLEPLALHS